MAISINTVIAISYHTDTMSSNSVTPSYSNHSVYRVYLEMNEEPRNFSEKGMMTYYSYSQYKVTKAKKKYMPI
jgi:hypothetical protein